MAADHVPGSWQWARAEAFRLAPAVGARIGQSPDGQTKTVAVGGRVHQCATWLAVYTVVAAIAADKRPARTVQEHAEVMRAVATVSCPRCGAPARATEAAGGGQRVSCPACGALALVPAAGPPRSVVPVSQPQAAIPEATRPTPSDLRGCRVTVHDGRLKGETVLVVGPGKEADTLIVEREDGGRWQLPMSRVV